MKNVFKTYQTENTETYYITCYFRLNEQTKKWLVHAERKHADFCEMLLQDLALYVGDDIQYSSCSHEHLRTDCTGNR